MKFNSPAQTQKLATCCLFRNSINWTKYEGEKDPETDTQALFVIKLCKQMFYENKIFN